MIAEHELKAALEAAGNDTQQAADLLRISRGYLYALLRKYGIPSPGRVNGRGRAISTRVDEATWRAIEAECAKTGESPYSLVRRALRRLLGEGG